MKMKISILNEPEYKSWYKNNLCVVYLLDYLGTPSHLRNQGIGSSILKRLESDLKKHENIEQLHIILESETPLDNENSIENLIRQRRINFYKRNGWVKMYEMATCGMRFDTMTFGKIPTELEKVQAYHKQIYGPTRTDVVIPLPKGETAPLPYWMK